ncbi:Venom serine protease 34-like [Camponotus japonicus]
MKAVLFGLLLLLFILTETKQSCNYYQNLEVGQTYYAFNPEYPNEFKGEANCIWQMTSPYDVKINCTINISNKTINTGRCEQNLTIQFDKKETKSVCKNDTFIIEGMNPIIIFNSTKKSQGIKFLCKIEVEKVLDKNCSCGKKKTTRIVGGNETGVNEYPMMAGIVDLQDPKIIYCGATIICQTYVVTAAHCVDNKTPEEIVVVVGEHNVSTGAETNATKVFRVTKIDIADAGDIALCKIKGVIKYSAEVGPVCLPFQHSCDSFGGDIVTALGWGLMGYADQKPDSLRKVKLNVISLKECEEAYSNNNDVNITSKNICTYTPGKDTCQMDSGGPVLWKDPTTNRLVLVGITSSGVACASKEPAVDTRVGYFINWIRFHTDGCQFCGVE